MRRVVKAQQLWYAIIESQTETGTPYMLYKDSCNRKSNQQNLGTIKCSNLCTEIVEYTSKDEVGGAWGSLEMCIGTCACAWHGCSEHKSSSEPSEAGHHGFCLLAFFGSLRQGTSGQVAKVLSQLIDFGKLCLSSPFKSLVQTTTSLANPCQLSGEVPCFVCTYP